MAIEKITAEQRELMKRKSAQALPDVPSGKGWTPRQFKDAVTKPLFDNENSFYAHINRIAEQLDLDKFNKEDYDINKTWYDVEEDFADHCISHMKTYPNDRKVFFASIGDTETIRYECVGLVEQDNEEGTYSCVVVSPTSIQTYEMSPSDEYPRKVPTSFDTLNLLELNVVGEITAGEPKSSRGVVTRNYLMNNYYSRQDTDTYFVDVNSTQNINGKKTFAEQIIAPSLKSTNPSVYLQNTKDTLELNSGKVKVNGNELATNYNLEAASENSKKYTDTKIAELIGGAPDELNTFKELADIIKGDTTGTKGILYDINQNKQDIAQLDNKKANRSELFNKDYNELVNKPDEALVILRDYVSDDTNKPAKEIELNGEKWALTAELDQISNITYQELVELRNQGKLIKGRQYRITDYVTTTVQEDTRSAGHQFDIIVVADDEKTLNCKARAIQHEGDTYFKNCDLSKWELWYDFENNTSKYEWADEANGKGVIYRMIDEWENDVPYDFKNIMTLIKTCSAFYIQLGYDENEYVYMFNKKVTEYSYHQWGSEYGIIPTQNYTLINGVKYYKYLLTTTPSAWSTNQFYIKEEILSASSAMYNYDGSLISYGGSIVKNEVYGTFDRSVIQNDEIVSQSSFGTSVFDNKIGNQENNSRKSIGYVCFCGSEIAINEFTFGVERVLFANTTTDNIFMRRANNIFVNGLFIDNTFLGTVTSSTFHQGAQKNFVADDYSHNHAYDYFSFNNFTGFVNGNRFNGTTEYNSFSGEFLSNELGGFSSNAGANFEYNKMGYSFGNLFGNNFNDNIFGENIIQCTFGNNVCGVLGGNTEKVLENYIENCVFENGVSYVKFFTTITANEENKMQNITFGLGLKGDSTTNRLSIMSTRNLTSSRTYVPAGSETIEV